MGDTSGWEATPLLDVLFEDPHAGRCLAASEGTVLRASHEWLRATGSTLDQVLGANVAPVPLPGGTGMLISAVDVAERKHLEDTLRETGDRFSEDLSDRRHREEALLRLASFPERNPNPIVEVGHAGQVEYLNPTAARLFPDLLARGRMHPWLADWPSVERALGAGGPQTHVREASSARRAERAAGHGRQE